MGTDGTASMTGKYNGCNSGLQELLNKPPQWIVCLLHTNELPLRLVFGVLDGSINGPVFLWGQLEQNCMGFTDQVYAFNIFWALIHGEVYDDLVYFEIGPIVHSRWLTLGCRILR